MKRILFVLALVLVSGLLFAQEEPAPQAAQSGSANGQLTMWQFLYTLRTQGDVVPPFQHRMAAAKGAPEETVAALGAAGSGEPLQLQAQKQTGDCDCDGTPDKDRLQDGSCGDGGDGPDKEPGGKGY